MLRIVIPSDFYKYIIGRQGGTKSSIEKDTKARIRVPQRGTEGDIGERIPNNSSPNAMIITRHTFANFVVQLLKGETVSRLSDAKKRLDIIVWSNRLKEPITHFISIPLNHPIIAERLNEFRS